MRVAIIQFDNRPLAQLGLMPFLIQRNREYAARHGYDHLFLDRPLVDLPAYWQKPHFCRRFLAGGYDIVAWLDTDAVVHDLDRRIETLFEGDEAMVGAGDNPFWDAPFNAGVFVARRPGGIELMDRWTALFPGARWTRTPTAWVCEEDWAGPAFEQGAFNLHLVEKAAQSGELRLADWRTLQSPFPVDGAFTLHFAGAFKANLPAYLETL